MNLPAPRAAALLLVLAAGCAKKGALPAVQEVDDVFVRAALATKAEVEPAPYMEMTGEVLVPMAGLRFPILVQMDAPFDSLTSAEVPGLGTILDGYVDGVAFEVNPLVGARIKDGPEASQVALDSDPRPWSNPASRYPTRRLAGQAEHAGVTCHVVEASLHHGATERLYFGVEDGLPRGSERTVHTAMGPIETRLELYDYAELCRGYPTPARVITHTGPLSQTVIFSGCRTEPLPRDLKLPQEIMDLRDQSRALPVPAPQQGEPPHPTLPPDAHQGHQH